ncbi:GNAT family N-acetyltransferase [Kitasatospora indigofera]|uniref:GNAT family N-acetyltransferase n=1 Tax=Kitasatospora indigofera TaxID=67307 RepID=UPI0036A58E2F
MRATFTEFANKLSGEGFAFLYSRMQADGVGPVLVTEIDGRISGAIGPMETMTDHQGRARLLPQYFGVFPDYRGQGYGRALWRAAMYWGNTNGADYQLLQTEIGGASDTLCRSEGLTDLGLVHMRDQPPNGRADVPLRGPLRRLAPPVTGTTGSDAHSPNLTRSTAAQTYRPDP